MQGTDTNEERVTDSIKRKAKELGDVNWQPKGYGNVHNLHIKPPNKASMNFNEDMFDFSDFSKNEKDKKQPFSRRMKFEKQNSEPSNAKEIIASNIFGKIDKDDAIDSN